MPGAIIEQKTIYQLEHAELVHYETNTPCNGLFRFNDHIIHTLLNGSKTLSWGNTGMEFKPGSILIPPVKEDIEVKIGRASVQEPVRCIGLNIDQGYLYNFYMELKQDYNLNWSTAIEEGCATHFYECNPLILNSLKSIFYKRQENISGDLLRLIIEMNIKELMIVLFQSQTRSFLLNEGSLQQHSALTEVIFYIKNNFKKNIRVKDLASHMCMSESKFYREFKRNLGCSPMEYLILERIKEAKNMLQRTDATIVQISLEVGFNSVEHFHRKFKALEGITPLQYRRKFS